MPDNGDKGTLRDCPPFSGPSRLVHSNSFSYRWRPMCSSPAYPTSAPLGDSTNADRSPTFHPVSSRSEDVTDFSSKGLLPQLIDVLHALTEGQELLSRKVQEARLEHQRHTKHIVEGRMKAQPSDPLAPRPLVGADPDTSIGICREQQSSGSFESGAGPTSANDFGNGPRPEPSHGSSTVPVSSTVTEASAPLNPPAATANYADTSAEVSSETSVQTDWPDPAPPTETTTASLNRDYNFFDELDARLADLQNPTDQSGDS